MSHTVFDDAVAKIAETVTNGAALRLFLILPQHLSYTVFRRLDQRQIGQRLGMDDSTVSRAMGQLLEIGAVERKGRGPVTEWKLSPDFGWRGDVNSYHKEQRKRGKPAPRSHIGPSPNVAEDILWNFDQSGYQLSTSISWPSKPGSMPGGRLARSQDQSMSWPICVSTVRRGFRRAVHS